MKLVTTYSLAAVTNRLPPEVHPFVIPLRQVMRRYRIDNVLRQAHFLGQILHESHDFRYREEIWGPTSQQLRYDPSSGSPLARLLGNYQPGDGYRYRGRGAIQLTGRVNYRRYGRYLGQDLEAQPERVAELPLYLDVAGWYWHDKSLNALADRGDAQRITLKINGGYNGLQDRINRTGRALAILQEQPPDPPIQLTKLTPRPPRMLSLRRKRKA